MCRQFGGPEMLALERENIATMRTGLQTQPPLVHAAATVAWMDLKLSAPM